MTTDHRTPDPAGSSAAPDGAGAPATAPSPADLVMDLESRVAYLEERAASLQQLIGPLIATLRQIEIFGLTQDVLLQYLYATGSDEAIRCLLDTAAADPKVVAETPVLAGIARFRERVVAMIAEEALRAGNCGEQDRSGGALH